jgi:hypothetical protein
MTSQVVTQLTLRIAYNGVTRTLEHVVTAEDVQALIARAVALFPGAERPHVQGLFREDGTEVTPGQSVAAAGLRDQELLLLRPRTVQGGSAG